MNAEPPHERRTYRTLADPETQAALSVGLGAVVLVEQLLAYQLFGVVPNDAYTYGGFGAIVGAVPLGIYGARRRRTDQEGDR